MITTAGRARLRLVFLAILVRVAITPVFAAASDPVANGSCISPQLASLDIGFTLTHETVDTEAEAGCSANLGAGATIDGTKNVVKHYDDPALRQRVESLLNRMATEGAKAARTIVWFRHANEEVMANRPADHLGMLVATNGKLPMEEVTNIVNYVSDAQAAGYSRFFVVVGPQGTSNPKCRKGTEWGGCYNEEFLGRTWSVIEQVATALHSPKLSKIEAIIDLSSENCAEANTNKLVYLNKLNFTRYMITRYRDKFGDHRFIASCGPGTEKVIFPALTSQESLFRELGVRPASVDIHIYETDPEMTRRFLLTADATARRLGVPLDILETYYDNTDILRLVSDLKSKNLLPSLRDLLVFPKKFGSSCHIDVPAPYDMKLLDIRLGRRTQDGQMLPVCR